MFLSLINKFIANWRTAAICFTSISMELCWLYALLQILNTEHVAGGRLYIPGILFILVLSFAFNMLIRRLSWPKIYLTLINWAIWIIVMLIAVKVQLFSQMAWTDPEWLLSLPQAVPRLIHVLEPQLILMITSAVIWWMGKWQAYRNVAFISSMTEFQFGLIALILIFIVARTSGIEVQHTTIITVLFFILALIGVFLAHLKEGNNWFSNINGFQWSWLVLVSIGLIFIAGMIITVAVSPEVLRLVVAAITWAGTLFMQALVWLAKLFPVDKIETALPSGGFVSGNETRLRETWQLPEYIRDWLNIAYGIFLFALLLAALWGISSQIYGWIRRKSKSSGVNTESLPGAFKADFITLLKNIIHKFIGLWLLLKTRIRFRAFVPEEMSAFQIYKRFLKWGAKQGFPRQISQTPCEYLCTISELLPLVRNDLSFITEHYVQVRYSRLKSTKVELLELNQRWKKVKQNHLKKSTG